MLRLLDVVVNLLFSHIPYTKKKTVCRSKVHQLQRGVASMLGEKKRISNFASTSRQTRLCTLVP